MKQIVIDNITYNLVPANEPIVKVEEPTPTMYVGAESPDGMFVFNALFEEDTQGEIVDKDTGTIEYKPTPTSEIDYWDNTEWLRYIRADISYTEHLPKDFSKEKRNTLQLLLNTVHDRGWL